LNPPLEGGSKIAHAIFGEGYRAGAPHPHPKFALANFDLPSRGRLDRVTQAHAMALPLREGWTGNRRRDIRLLDLGCGTGVLGIAMAKLWRTRVLAADIDTIAVEVARANARLNGAGPLVRTVAADGFDHPAIRARAPFDLIVANILAGPLTRLAPAFTRALAPGGTAVLSGLLRNQENLVLSFYRSCGLVFRRRLRQGPWSALVLERPAS